MVHVSIPYNNTSFHHHQQCYCKIKYFPVIWGGGGGEQGMHDVSLHSATILKPRPFVEEVYSSVTQRKRGQGRGMTLKGKSFSLEKP